MSNLQSQTPFDGFAKSFDGLSLKELSGFEIVSLAIANGATERFFEIFRRAFDASPPKPGRWALTNSGKVLWTGQSQYFVFSDAIDSRLDKKLRTKFSETAYTTLQTDGWAVLEISGSNVHDVLERFVPLNLRSWEAGFGSRSSAHHMGIIIIKVSPQCYHLLTPTSSSGTFLDALIHVVENVVKAG